MRKGRENENEALDSEAIAGVQAPTPFQEDFISPAL